MLSLDLLLLSLRIDVRNKGVGLFIEHLIDILIGHRLTLFYLFGSLIDDISSLFIILDHTDLSLSGDHRCIESIYSV